MNRRETALLLALLATSRLSQAQSAALAEGTHYATLRDPQPPSTAGKIDVVEFFSYGCPACNAFDAGLERWVATLASDVAFKRVPVPFLGNADNFQRTFYALEVTGMFAKVHSKVFEAVHVEKRRLAKAEEIAEVVSKAGGDKDKFMGAFNAFSMSAYLARAKAATAACRIEQIPTLVVAGRYLTSPAQAGGAREALATADFLLQKARKA